MDNRTQLSRTSNQQRQYQQRSGSSQYSASSRHFNDNATVLPSESASQVSARSSRSARSSQSARQVNHSDRVSAPHVYETAQSARIPPGASPSQYPSSDMRSRVSQRSSQSNSRVLVSYQPPRDSRSQVSSSSRASSRVLVLYQQEPVAPRASSQLS